MQLRRFLNGNILRTGLSKNSFHKNICKDFSSSIEELKIPVIDIEKFLKKSGGWENECKLASDCLHESGIMIVKDPVISYFIIL